MTMPRALPRPLAARHFWTMLALSGAVVLVLFVLSVGLGKLPLSPLQVIRALTGNPEEELHQIIVVELRLPRALIAVLAGAMLGVAGALLQGITRNPLASPELTGVSAGVVFLAVVWLAYGPSSEPTAGAVPTGVALPAIALVGGVASGLLVYALSRRGRTDPLRLVLAGVLVSLIVQSATSLIVLANQGAVGGILVWAIGSLNGRVWTHWGVLWPWALTVLPLALACAAKANVLALGDELAVGLGERVELSRAGLFLVAAVLTAGALAVVGAIGFVGLIAPHIARRLAGEDARRVFPLTATTGAALLTGSDVLARVVKQPLELPTGAVTAVLGAMFFLYLLRRGPG